MAKRKATKSAPARAGRPVPVKVQNPPPPTVNTTMAASAFPSLPTPSRQQKPDPTRPTIIVQTGASGSSGTHIYGGYFSEEYLLNELRGQAQADAYDKMYRSDAKTAMALDAVVTPIVSSNWEMHPATDSDEHKAHAEYIEHVIFRDMARPFSRQELVNSIAKYGYYILEITHKPVFGHPLWGNYVGLKSLGYRSPRSILYWRLDPEDGSIDCVRQLITGDLQRFVDLPGQFLLVGSLRKEGDNYEGISLLRPAYGAWKRKNLYLKLAAIGAERNAVPTPVLVVPDGKENSVQYDNAILSLQNYTSHQNSYATFPEGWKYEFLKSDFDPEKLKSLIEFENSEIVSAFMANFLLLGSTQSGSRAVSMDQSEFFLGAIQYVADEVCAPFNAKLIPDLIRMKFGPQEAYPQLKITGISDKAGAELAEALQRLAQTQYIQPDDELEEHLRKRYQLTKKSDQGVRIVQAPKAMQQGDNVVTTDHPEEVEEKERNVAASELTAKTRKKLKGSNFALPAKRKYPIHDVAHARNALARVAQYGTVEEKARVRRAVYARYPQLARAKADQVREWGSIQLAARARREEEPARLIWNTTGDNTCEDCASMDGTVWDADDPSLPELPLHPNCGCELAEYTGPGE